MVGREAIPLGCDPDEIRELVCPGSQVLEVEHAVGKPPEVPGHSVLQNLSTGTEERGSGGKLAADVKQVRLVPARAMQQQQRQGGLGPRRRNEPVDESTRFAWRAHGNL